MNNFCTLNIKKHLDKKANYHTHTTRCKHAWGTEREYIEHAIQAGFEVLGFSDHAPYFFEDKTYISRVKMDLEQLEDYITIIDKLKSEYKKDIIIYTGLEMENYPATFDQTLEYIKQYPLDYLIQGQHCFTVENWDESTSKPWEDESLLNLYLERLETALETGLFLYVAHPDIINFAGDGKIYDKYLWKIARLLKKFDMPIEVNVNGFRKKAHYPNLKFIEIGIQNGNDFIIGVDAHKPEELLDYENFDGCVKLVTDRGGRIINL